MGVVSTNRAQCRDCYRCVRVCPVKAVRVQSSQAEVVSDLCIACANCVRECPQGAKSIRDDLPIVLDAMRAGRPVYASVAPSVPAYFDIESPQQLGAILLEAGFSGVEETAMAAEMVGREHGRLIQVGIGPRPLLATACPALVALVEKYYPSLIPHLAPLVSPMVAHGRWLKKRFGEDALIAFIGPCIAKKAEIEADSVAGAIDAALTFSELHAWLLQKGLVSLPLCDLAVESKGHQAGEARVFPVEGGLVKIAGQVTDILSSDIIVASGIDACREALKGIQSGALKAQLVELMACPGGCINGPDMPSEQGMFVNRQKVLAYAARAERYALPPRQEWPDLSRSFADRSPDWEEPPEEALREILAKIDKVTPEDELNCGACGYSSCRDKAVATYRGMAELTMCMPYMRRRAESLTNVVMDVTPNAVVVVDGELKIQDLSRSAETMFGHHSAAVRGKPLITVLPIVDDFIRARDTGREIFDQIIELRPDLIVAKTVVWARDRKLLIGIFRDVTQEIRSKQGLDRIRSETLQRTQEVINKQMRVSHEIASLLGETTAETKVLLTKLKRLLQEQSDDEAEKKRALTPVPTHAASDVAGDVTTQKGKSSHETAR